jgi:putative transposase
MPRRKLIYTDAFPYHINARANNKEWFYLPKDQVWRVFVKELNNLSENLYFKVHAFVLMDNHYHLLASTHSRFNLGVVMQKLQKNVSLKINREAGRINHLFGGPYRGSLVMTPDYYKTVLKYVYRNPVKAELCSKVEDYEFSTLNSGDIRVQRPQKNQIDCFVNYDQSCFYNWLNHSFDPSKSLSVQKGLYKTEFKPVVAREPKASNLTL